MKRPTVPIWWSITVAFGAVVILAIACMAYTNHVQRESDRRAEAAQRQSDQRWCSLFTSLEGAYQEASTVVGRAVLAEIVKLRTALGCAPPR